MSPTFSSGKMKSMFEVMNGCGVLMAENVKNKIQKNGANEDFELNVRHLAGCYTMDVIAKCCFATDTDSFNDSNQQFVEHTRKLNDFSKLRLLLIMIVFICLPNRVRKFFNVSMFPSIDFFRKVSTSVLEQRRQEGNANSKYKDFLQLLIDASKNVQKFDESGSKVADNESHHGCEEANEKVIKETLGKESDLKRPLTDDEIIANSVLFFAVGYDTTGSLITMTMYQLALNQGAQDKLFEEIKSAHDENGGKLNYETISGLKYLDAVISETLRLLPPAPIIARTASEEYTFQKNGIKVLKGTSVILPIWNLHHDPKYWTEPETFEPERFLAENRDKITPYTYIPFGGGPMNCIGMRFALLEAKLAIAHLVFNFKFNPCSQTDVPLDLSATIGLLNPKRVYVGVSER